MREDKLESVKKEIRSVIITFPRGIILSGFVKAYKQLLGRRLPTREFGYTSDVDFLYSLPDVVRVITDKNGEYQLKCVADESTEHIQKLVVNQRVTKSKQKNNSHRNTYHRTEIQVRNNVFRQKPFISAGLRENLFIVLCDYPDGISYHSLLLAYQKKLKKRLNLDWLSESNHDRLEKLASVVPELEVKVVNDTERLFFSPNKGNEKDVPGVKHKAPLHTITIESKNQSMVKHETPLCTTNIRTITPKECLKSDSNGKMPDISAIPRNMRNDFEKVLKQYPTGILARHFPLLYEKMNSKIFDLLELGYNNFLELADALPDTFICVKSYESPNDWMVFHPSFQENVKKFRDINLKLKNEAEKCKKSAQISNKPIPKDISPATMPFTKPQIPKDIEPATYIPVFVSDAVNPSRFWLKFQLDEVIIRFRELEEEMQSLYYSCAGDAYTLSKSDVMIGTTCVALYEDHCYRVTVISLHNEGLVDVYFVDYGSWEKVHCSNLRYLKYTFMTLPAQAFKAQLASVKPSGEATNWSRKAQGRFMELCSKSSIMARIHLKLDDVISVFLCDTSGKDDIHINDTLIDEGLAQSISYSVACD